MEALTVWNPDRSPVLKSFSIGVDSQRDTRSEAPSSILVDRSTPPAEGAEGPCLRAAVRLAWAPGLVGLVGSPLLGPGQ